MKNYGKYHSKHFNNINPTLIFSCSRSYKYNLKMYEVLFYMLGNQLVKYVKKTAIKPISKINIESYVEQKMFV